MYCRGDTSAAARVRENGWERPHDHDAPRDDGAGVGEVVAPAASGEGDEAEKGVEGAEKDEDVSDLGRGGEDVSEDRREGMSRTQRAQA